MESNERSSPAPNPASHSLLRDISNFKTPKRPSHNPKLSSPSPHFFTASAKLIQTPRTSFRRHHRPSLSARKTATARRLKAFEFEQSQSSRKAQIRKEQSLKSLSKALTTWLNFLFQNPRSCGCGSTSEERQSSEALGKREGGGPGGDGIFIAIDGTWRCPKRQKGVTWHGEDSAEGMASSKSYKMLRSSLKDVCSVDDLKQRMRVYLSLACCREVCDVMTHVVKTIDEGRLKMKSHCPVVTDVGMKEKAVRILMCYNPIWLRIGLHIIFGGESLLPDGNVNSEQEMSFLKMVIDKQFFSHAGLAKAYAYNKNVEGLYKPGYYEALGNAILKRFLLLVLVLDRAKSQNTLPIKYGIDGIDGGSPPLFLAQSSIKSSCEVINDFLPSEVMHGQGNLLAHLVILGYKVLYQQSPLVDYDFKVKDLFMDLQDGVRLCRAIQLLQNDASILAKLLVPSNTHKKNLENCGLALQYLRRAGVSLNDEDGMAIVEDDVANGDKELTISLLWNIFVQLQLPLLIDNRILGEEIEKILGTNEDFSQRLNLDSSPLDLLRTWIQAVCKKYDQEVNIFSSLVDGKAIWCLLDYYFRKELCCSRSLKDTREGEGNCEESIMSSIDHSDAVHNFILSQKLTTLLGDFPEVLETSDILKHGGAISEQSVVVLLVFLASQLTVKKTMDQLNFHKLLECSCQSSEKRRSSVQRYCEGSRTSQNKEEIAEYNNEDAAKKFKAIKAWWQDMAERNNKFLTKPVTSTLQRNSTSDANVSIERVNAAKIIQSFFRQSTERKKYLKLKNAVLFLQIVIRAWLIVKQKQMNHLCTAAAQELRNEKWNLSEKVRRYVQFIFERHGFLKLQRSVLLIQRATRTWIARRKSDKGMTSHDVSHPNPVSAAIVIQKHIRGWATRSRRLHNQHHAATKIQSHFRGWQLRRKFDIQKLAITTIQSSFRRLMCWKAFQKLKAASRLRSAIVIQSHVRGWIARRRTSRHRYLVCVIQRCFRGWVIRRNLSLQRESVKKIQSAIRGLNCRELLNSRRQAVIDIQRFARGQITRNKLLGASHNQVARNVLISSWHCQSLEMKIMLSSIVKLQRWWRCVLLHKIRTQSAINIQSHVRGWLARERASRDRRRITVIQSYWKGHLARKESGSQLTDLCSRVQKSAKNVDDSMRIINRLKLALSELPKMKSVTEILRTCATLDIATENSQRCCEELVAAGAVDNLLKQIQSVTQSIPDQEILKHALSTLRNLARYQHLIGVLVNSHRSVETIFWVMLRNKDEGYFIASEILKKICSNQKGNEAMHKLPAYLKRLHMLVEELTKKATNEKKNAKSVAVNNTDRRLREAVELLKMMMDS